MRESRKTVSGRDSSDNGRWSTRRGVNAWIDSEWEKGALQERLLASEGLVAYDGFPFPLAVKTRLPAPKDVDERFASVSEWFSEFNRDVSSDQRFRVELRNTRNSKGFNAVPSGVFVDSPENLLKLLGKTRQDAYRRLSVATSETLREFPRLSAWMSKRSNLKKLGENLEDWGGVRAFLSWYAKNPFPGVYVREADVEGVDTKFVERHAGILSSVFAELFPSPDARASADFFERYGFRVEKDPPFVRFRVFDERGVRIFGGNTRNPEMVLSASAFAELDMDIDTVFIVENKTTYLSFPDVGSPCIVILGNGYGGAAALSEAKHLSRKRVFYRGDLDTHGFGILNLFRSRIPNVVSLLMDEETMLRHKALWTAEDDAKAYSGDAKYLTESERDMLGRLAARVFLKDGKRARLEQERIGWKYALERTKTIAMDISNR